MFHLVHPAWVHFPVAFLIAGAAVEAWGLLTRREAASRTGGALVIAGTLTLLPTVVTGYLAANTVDVWPEAQRTLEAHERAAWALLALFVGGQFWKAWGRGSIPEGQRVAYAALLLAGVALMAYVALLGGRLVYTFGVGVLAP